MVQFAALTWAGPQLEGTSPRIKERGVRVPFREPEPQPPLEEGRPEGVEQQPREAKPTGVPPPAGDGTETGAGGVSA